MYKKGKDGFGCLFCIFQDTPYLLGVIFRANFFLNGQVFEQSNGEKRAIEQTDLRWIYFFWISYTRKLFVK